MELLDCFGAGTLTWLFGHHFLKPPESWFQTTGRYKHVSHPLFTARQNQLFSAHRHTDRRKLQSKGGRIWIPTLATCVLAASDSETLSKRFLSKRTKKSARRAGFFGNWWCAAGENFEDLPFWNVGFPLEIVTNHLKILKIFACGGLNLQARVACKWPTATKHSTSTHKDLTYGTCRVAFH